MTGDGAELPEEQPVERTPLRPGVGGFLYDIVDPSLDGPLKPSRRDLVAFSLYLACAAVYVAIGVWTLDFLFSFWTALAYLLLAAWLVPAAVRKLL